MSLKTLIIDDHPLQIEGYKTVLSFLPHNKAMEVTSAHNCKEAYDIIVSDYSSELFDMVFLDYSLPAYPEKNILDGGDLALLIKAYSPTSKILILTSHAEAFTLQNIIKKTAPEGVLVKSDFNGDELLDAVNAISRGEKYYSQTVIEGLNKLSSLSGFLDSNDKRIILMLSQGYKTETMANELDISKSTIEKRKVRIKQFLHLEKANDEDILRKCRMLGFI